MRTPTLAELPPPPEGRTGWPWTEESPRLPPSRPDGRPWPRISITTPSFNQGAFLEETIRSVLLQGYPDIEYSIFDGGSTDETVEVICKYEQWLSHWQSEPDRGQSHAVNMGWARASGDLLSWLCSDDVLLPSALHSVAGAWGHDDEVAMITGGVVATDARSRMKGQRLPLLPLATPADISLLDHEDMFLPQPSSFYVRSHLDRVGRWLREDLQYTMDREILYRLCRSGEVVLLREPLATYRIHADSKTIAASLKQHLEAPRALAYCTWGGADARKRRARVGAWRVAKGHYLYALGCRSRLAALAHLIRAGVRKPTYLSLARTGTQRILLRSLGLLTVARTLRNAARRSPAAPELSAGGGS